MIPRESSHWAEPVAEIPPPSLWPEPAQHPQPPPLTEEQFRELLERGRRIVRDAAAQLRGLSAHPSEFDLVLR